MKWFIFLSIRLPLSVIRIKPSCFLLTNHWYDWVFSDPIITLRPRRSKLCIACSDLFYKSERTHTVVPPFQTANACAGLRFEKMGNKKRKYPNWSHPPKNKSIAQRCFRFFDLRTASGNPQLRRRLCAFCRFTVLWMSVWAKEKTLKT